MGTSKERLNSYVCPTPKPRLFNHRVFQIFGIELDVGFLPEPGVWNFYPPQKQKGPKISPLWNRLKENLIRPWGRITEDGVSERFSECSGPKTLTYRKFGLKKPKRVKAMLSETL